MRTRPAAVALVISALCLSLANASARADTAPGCKVPQTRIVGQSSEMRVLRFTSGPNTGTSLACWQATGELIGLGPGYYPPPAFAVAGEFLVNAVDNCQPVDAVSDGGCETTVEVYRPFAGPDQHQLYTPAFFHDAVEKTIVGSIVARPNGGAAWIACRRRGEQYNSSPRHCLHPGRHAQVVAVNAFRGRRRLLDEGDRIDPSSLRLHGRTVSWRSDGSRHSVRI
jgi:hypothetical protein